MAIQEHRNGVQSIEVKLLSIKDEDGKELNNWYNKKPGTVINMVRGEAERLIAAKRAIATSDIKKKGTKAPANKRATAAINK